MAVFAETTILSTACTLARQQEHLPVTTTLPLPKFVHICWMRLCLSPASAPHKQQTRDVPDSHTLVLIRGSSEAGREMEKGRSLPPARRSAQMDWLINEFIS